jgi:predicted DNA-binding transcriptional regulator AlpA
MQRPIPPSADRLLAARDVAFYAGVSVRTVWRWVEQGLLEPPIRLGARCTRWRPQAIQTAIERAGAAAGKEASCC